MALAVPLVRRHGATEEDSNELVTHAEAVTACGDNARYLKPYQLVGVNFLMLLYRQKIGGAILADEMGLGKTAQLITYLGGSVSGSGWVVGDAGCVRHHVCLFCAGRHLGGSPVVVFGW